MPKLNETKLNHKILKIFVLEDDGERGKFFMSSLAKHSLTICNNAQAAITILNAMQFDIIFLDHDLGGDVYVDNTKESNTGMFVVQRLPEIPLNSDTPVIIHSWNMIAAAQMLAFLRNARHVSTTQAIFGSPGFISILSQILEEQ